MTGAPLGDPFYRKFLRQVHWNTRPRTYVEIGVYTGDSLSLAAPRTHVVGIDPAAKITRELSRRTTVYEETSDDFFAQHDLAALIGTVDLAFIDGLHLFEQALRDFTNLERHMSPNGVILVHDCYPPDQECATRTQRPGPWAGDVWKLLPILKDYRPDLNVNVVAVRPTGLGIITQLDPSNNILRDHFDAIVATYMDREYVPWDDALDGDWAGVEHLFPVFRRRDPMEQAVRAAKRGARVLKALTR
jgi:hypothetical protein